MNVFKSMLLASGAMLALSAGAQAADLPTKKGEPVAPAKIDCSGWNWWNNSAADCPLSAAGFTLYGQIDVGFGYETNAAKFNRAYPNGVQETISKQSHGGQWQLVPNGLSQSNVGVKWKEKIAPDWFIIGDVNFGFDPYSVQFANGPLSQALNNTTPQWQQTANGDSSRAYGPVNTRAYIGVQNPTFGTLTYGRQYAFSNDNANSYDPFGGAYAFSLISSGTLGGGLGDTELARYTNSIKYMYADHGFRAGVLSQVGGWSAGNNAQYAIEGDIGFDWNGFSFDGVYEYAKDAVALSAFGGSTAPYASTVLKATIENQKSVQLMAKYKWNQFSLFGGYEYERDGAPSDLPATATIGTFNGGYQAVYGLTGTGTQLATAFPVPKVVQVAYVGGRYAVMPNLDLAAGYYHVWQKDFRGATADTSPSTTCLTNTATSGPYTLKGTVSAKCAGTEDVISGMIDWRPYKRLDVYGGVMFSQVNNGMASGFIANQNVAFTSGVRLSF